MTMMTIDVTKLAGAFGPFVLIFAAQVIFTCLWAYFITFRTCGRNYDAAVIAAVHLSVWGWATDPTPWPMKRPSWRSTAFPT